MKLNWVLEAGITPVEVTQLGQFESFLMAESAAISYISKTYNKLPRLDRGYWSDGQAYVSIRQEAAITV